MQTQAIENSNTDQKQEIAYTIRATTNQYNRLKDAMAAIIALQHKLAIHQLFIGIRSRGALIT